MKELVRVVRRPDGELAVGRTLPGRGAWLCTGSRTCLDAAARRHGFDRALRASLRADAVTALGRQLDQCWQPVTMCEDREPDAGDGGGDR